ncbi:N(4)-(beta-N-acetylglucosaminyl)-L-asparaginase [Crocinitomicaceae bacterium]|nr:N(4)-(beta-N-acetylglucosaminyl)-L-asparaginase [Crocinitomicaceae bacterium]
MQRRTFFKWGAIGTVLGITQPVQATQFFADDTLLDKIPMLRYPIVVSTWKHGLEANKEAWKVLSSPNSNALDAVEAAARQTESDRTNRSVGISGMPDREGHVTLDACIMDHNSKCGSVGFIEGYEHPISIARSIMENTQHVMLVGEGAEDYAKSHGFPKIKSPIKEVKKEYKTWKKENKDLFKKPKINHENHDTIGILAIDTKGNISGACTTSGWAYKLHGRIGDSPIIGAGLFIDNEVGGAVATGLGEAIIRIAGSHTVVELMRQGKTPQEACKAAVERIIAKHDDLTGLQCGFIALNKYGQYGAYSVYNGFNFALKSHYNEEMVDAPFDRNW